MTVTSRLFARPSGVLLLTLALTTGAALLIPRLPVLMYPQTRRAQVTVTYRHPGLSASDFRNLYARNLEGVWGGLPDLDLLTTTYSTDQSDFTMVFSWGVKTETALASVNAVLPRADAYLPSYLRDQTTIRTRAGENAGSIVIGVSAASTAANELYRQLTERVRPLLESLEGLEELAILPAEELRVDITVRPDALLNAGLTIDDLQTALNTAFTPQPLGRLDTPGGRYSVRVRGAEASLDTLFTLPVGRRGGDPVVLSEVADISAERTLPARVFLVGDAPALQVTASPADGADLVALSDRLDHTLRRAVTEGLLPSDTRLTFYLDPARYIRRSIDNVVQSAAVGGVLAILMVFLFLGEVRNTLLVAASLPLSLVASLGTMQLTGMSLNLISLGGLALAVGMIVDATIVVIENIHRHRSEHTGLTDDAAWRRLVIGATEEVRTPVVASTLTSLAVFLPLSGTAPLANAILGDQARTVIYALGFSLVVSLTVVPLLAYFLHRSQPISPPVPGGPLRLVSAGLRHLVRLYETSLTAIVTSRWRSSLFLGLSLAAIVLTLALALPLLPKEILPLPGSDRVVLFFRNDRITDSRVLLREHLPEIQAKVRDVLGPRLKEMFVNLSGRFNQILVDLESARMGPEAVLDLQAAFESHGDWYYNALRWDPAALPLPEGADLQFQILGPDPARKLALLEEARTLLTDRNLFRRVFLRPSASVVQDLELVARPEVIDRLSPWNATSLSQTLRRSLSGTTPVSLTLDGHTVSFAARYPQDWFSDLDRWEYFFVPWRDQFVPLKHFFEVESRQGVSQIVSERGQEVYRLIARSGPEISDPERAHLASQAVEALADWTLPEGYRIQWEDGRQEINEAVQSLLLALGLSAVILFLILTFQYDSIWVPLIVLLAVPYGLVGVVLSLLVFHSTLNLNSLLGTILLSGLVVNNSILLIDFYLQRRRSADPIPALRRAATTRLVPILITSATTFLGMLPLSLGWGEGSNILQPLGIAVSGGLLVSTVLTLYGVPSLIRLWEDFLPGRPR